MRAKIAMALILLVALVGTLSAQETRTLTLLTHDSFNVSEDVLKAFEEESGITVSILRVGDAGQMVNQAILSKSAPLADLMYGVDNTFLSRALNADLFIPYESPALKDVDETFVLDEAHNVTPIDYSDVCLNYDVGYFEAEALDVPQTLADLTKPEYKGLLVALNPATSSPGLAFLLATIEEFGTEGEYTYLDYWTDLVANDVLITDGWTEAYFGEFTMGSETGTRPIVVSYATSIPFTYVEEDDAATTASVIGDNTCFRQIEFAGILQGTEHEAEAQKFIDFLLSRAFQEDMPMQMYVFPVNEKAEQPELFVEYALRPENPVMMDYALIEENREQWIQDWTETVLR
jgi:thiamine transport system substrate-binding protein